MYATLLKKAFLFLSIIILTSLACDLSVTATAPTSPALQSTNTMLPATADPTQIPASPTGIPATLAPSAIPATLQPSLEGVEVSVDPLRIVLSPMLASGARGIQFSRAEGDDVPPWELTPGHIQLKLEGYLLQDTFHEPQIYVYPAQGYAELVPAAFESMHRLNNILYDPAAPISSYGLPRVPFFNAGQAFASNIQVISFQNGRGVRFLTEYAQYFASANNDDLFYHFQGLTGDGAYYIIAILPITAPVLAENNDAAAIPPPGGIPYPDIADPDADWQGYYSAVTNLLNTTSPEAFTPTINQLDQLIQSMRITP
jgi:hypothetical protein